MLHPSCARLVLSAALAALLAGASGCDTPGPQAPPEGEPAPLTRLPESPGACRTDADCRVFADLCEGCDCRALSRRDPDPVCKGPGVQCFANPCAGQEAICRAGRCALAADTSR
jgi:hypothetical protein